MNEHLARLLRKCGVVNLESLNDDPDYIAITKELLLVDSASALGRLTKTVTELNEQVLQLEAALGAKAKRHSKVVVDSYVEDLLSLYAEAQVAVEANLIYTTAYYEGGGYQRCALCHALSNGLGEPVIHDPACAYLPIERAYAKVEEMLLRKDADQ